MATCLTPTQVDGLMNEQDWHTAHAEPVALVGHEVPGSDPEALKQPISISRAEVICSARLCLLCSGFMSSPTSCWHNTAAWQEEAPQTHFSLQSTLPRRRGSGSLLDLSLAARLSSLPISCRTVPFPIASARATRPLWRRCWFNAAAQPQINPVTTSYLR